MTWPRAFRALLDQFGSAQWHSPRFARRGPRLVVLRPILGAPSNGWRRTRQPSRYHRQPRSPTTARARIVALLGPIPVSIDGCALPLLSYGQVLLELAVAGRLCRHGVGWSPGTIIDCILLLLLINVVATEKPFSSLFTLRPYLLPGRGRKAGI